MSFAPTASSSNSTVPQTQQAPPPTPPTGDPTTTATSTNPDTLSHLTLTLHNLLTPLPPKPTNPELPPPQQFDFLPPLHSLISNLLTNDDLDPKEISHQANPIRVKLAKARQLVSDLPDISRNVEEQMVEIAELEARIDRQKRMMREALELVRAEIAKAKESERKARSETGEPRGGGGGDAGVRMEVDE